MERMDDETLAKLRNIMLEPFSKLVKEFGVDIDLVWGEFRIINNDSYKDLLSDTLELAKKIDTWSAFRPNETHHGLTDFQYMENRVVPFANGLIKKYAEKN